MRISLKHKLTAFSVVVGSFMLGLFQNCSPVEFKEETLGRLGVCGNVSCELTPLTYKPAVTTVLIALGDEADDQLVVNGASSQLIAETIVRYTTPDYDPKILVVVDENNGGEDPEDTTYVSDVLLGRYNVTILDLSQRTQTLSIDDLKAYDLVWFNNPGHEMGSVESRDALLQYKGGVVLQGDDLSRGRNFAVTDLTGVRAIDNGTSVVCNGTAYAHDNNAANQYRVSLSPDKIPGANSSTINFRYGNDIDLVEPVRSDLEILAVAVGGPSECTETRPAIVRYEKPSDQ